MSTLLAASSTDSEDETPVSQTSKPKIAVVTATGTVLLLLDLLTFLQRALL